MDFGFSDEQEMLRSSARRFLEAECPTRFVRKMMADATGLDGELWRKLVDLGWLGLMIPEEHGGQGGSFLDLVVVIEETGRALLPGPFFATALASAAPLLEGGSSAQHGELLPRIARGELRLSLAVAEEDGRCDADAVALRGRVEGDQLFLTGEKHFVPDAHVADLLVVATRTAGAGERGVTLCLVDARDAGVRVQPLRTVDMTRRVCRVTLENVRVPANRVLGLRDEGWPILRRALQQSVTALTAEMVGTAQQALDRAVAYAKERVQFGRPIGEFQLIQLKLAKMEVARLNVENLVFRVLESSQAGKPMNLSEASAMKLYAAGAATEVALEAVQLFGGNGYMAEYEVEQLARDAKVLQIYAGTDEIQVTQIARSLLA